ncbi:MAG TPA: ATP-binding protein, partial [Acidimicrobiia bacterium]|nr:ATP-binding protein [Acidimicrobiia bacterium]
LITDVAIYEIVIASLILLALAVVGMTAKTQGMAAGAVSLGLVTSAGIIVRYLDGSIESQFAFLLALVAVSFYEEWRLVLAGLVYVAGFQIFNFLVMYREAYVQRYGVAHLGLPLVFLAMTFVLVGLLIAGWRLSRQEDGRAAGEDGFRAGFEKVDIGMALLTPSGEFIHANEALVRMFGPVAGSNIRGLIHADDLADLGQAWEDMGNGDGQTATTWMRWRASDGRAIWGRLSLSFLRSARQRPATILLQLEDSTRAHHDELRLERAIQGRDEFVAAIAEDIRVPVGAVLDLTAQAEGDPVDLHLTVRRIESHAREVASIVDDLFISARAGNAPLQPLSRAVDAVVLCREALSEVPGAERIPIEAGATSLWADPGMTIRILDSLVANAIRYGGSMVSLETAGSGPDTVISVIDDGPAIPIPERERIFNGDLRAGGPVTRPAAVGLSLTVARQLARQMDGDITYRRTGDGRNVFELRLPSESLRAGQGAWEEEPVRIPA